MQEPDHLRAFLEDLQARLRGSARWRRDTIDDIRSHVIDALDGDDADAYRTPAGLVERFGEPSAVAADLNREARRARLRRDSHLIAAGLATLSAIVYASATLDTRSSPTAGDGLPALTLLERKGHRLQITTAPGEIQHVNGELLGLLTTK